MPTRSLGELAHQRPEVARLHADVRVRDDVDLAGGDALEADQLRDLGVDGGVGVGDDDPGVEPRVARDEATRHAEGRVVRRGHPEEQLERRVVDARERLEVGLEVVVAPGQRLEDAHRAARGRCCGRRASDDP